MKKPPSLGTREHKVTRCMPKMRLTYWTLSNTTKMHLVAIHAFKEELDSSSSIKHARGFWKN